MFENPLEFCLAHAGEVFTRVKSGNGEIESPAWQAWRTLSAKDKAVVMAADDRAKALKRWAGRSESEIVAEIKSKAAYSEENDYEASCLPSVYLRQAGKHALAAGLVPSLVLEIEAMEMAEAELVRKANAERMQREMAQAPFRKAAEEFLRTVKTPYLDPWLVSPDIAGLACWLQAGRGTAEEYMAHCQAINSERNRRLENMPDTGSGYGRHAED